MRGVKKDDVNQTLLQWTEYAADNARLLTLDPTTNQWSIYASVGGTVLAEYTEFSPSNPTWVKSYTYLGSSQLSTITPNGTGGEYTEYNHPDRLGTRVITNQQGGTSYEQAHLPFGTALNAESSVTNNNKRFTSYDRSSKTGLDYAINRTYDSKQGRFTQVDPIDMQAVDLKEPQTLNLYTYAVNDPINHVDPDGLFFGKLFKWLGKVLKAAFKWIAVAISVAIAVLTIVYAPILFATALKQLLGIISAVANAAQSVLSAVGLNKAAAVFGIISSFASLGTAILDFRAAAKAFKLKALFSVVSNAATAVSRALAAFGHQRLGQIFRLISTVTGFIGEGLKETNKGSLKWHPSSWDVYKFVRSSSEQIANIAGATRLAGYLNVLGIVDDLYDSYRGIKNLLKNNVGGGDKVYELDFRRNERRELSWLRGVEREI